ncbi:MAG: response regulator [Armatimonadetes bacterium]|nr:response regulator [Armatimonadota bacterium]
MSPPSNDETISSRVAAIPDAVPIPQQHTLIGARVLVADDERDARSLISLALQSAGAHVVTAHCASEAVKMALQNDFDILVTDLSMPDGDGFSLLRSLRLRGKKMPAIALSALRGPEIEQKVKDAGFALHLDKPIEVSFLTAAVTDALWHARQK